MDSQQIEKDTLDALLRKVQGSTGQQAVPVAAAPEVAFEEASSIVDDADPDARRSRSDLFRSVHLKVRVELGRVHLPLKDALQLGPGSVVDLDKLADDPVEIYVNDLLIARGEVIVVNDCFCVRVTEVFSQGESGHETR